VVVVRRTVAPPPEPPWVWGPSEIDDWIRGTHPSTRRTRGASRNFAAKIAHFRVKLGGASVREVRLALVHAFEAIGFPAVDQRGSRITATGSARRAVAHVHGSVIGSRVVVSIRFEPPTFRSKCKHVLHLLSDRFEVLSVHSKEEGDGLPAKW